MLLGGVPRVGAAIVLVRDGETNCAIVVPQPRPQPDARGNTPVNYEWIAADELALHLKKISGAEVPVIVAGQGAVPAGHVRILIGAAATEAVPTLDVERALGGRVDDMSSRDGFVTRARDNIIALAGVRPPGTAYAVSDLLERLGCRWFFPGELGTIIPQKRTISIDEFETVQTPSFDLRSMWVCGFGGNRLNKDDISAGGELQNWLHRNRMSYDYQWNAQHNMADTPGESLGKPEQVEKVANRILAEFDAAAERGQTSNQMYSMGWNDSYCRVSREQGLGIVHPWYPMPQATDPLIGFYNKVIETVELKYPGRKYGFLAYMNYLPAPVTVKVHPSLVPVVAPIEQCPRHVPGSGQCWQRDALMKAMQGWCSMSNKVLLYDYEPGFLIDGGIPVPSVTRMRTEYPMWHKAGLRGLFAQVQMTIMNNGPNLYVRHRLGWDIDADVDKIMDEYFGMLFGPAGKDARAYWDGLEYMMHNGRGHQHEDEIMKIVYPINEVRKLGAHVRAAERKASGIYAQRLEMIRYSYKNLMLYLQMRAAEDRAQFAKAGKIARQIWALREQIETINPYFYKIGDLDRMNEDYDFLTIGWAKHNEGRATLIDGTKGDLVAMTDDVWSFSTDPRDLGVIKRWYTLEQVPADWKKIRTSQIWETQGDLEDKEGRGYDGVAWYMTKVNVPKKFAGRKIAMNFGGVFGKMLIWVNGEFAHYRPWKGPWWTLKMNTAFDIDVTDVIKPGQTNTITIRVDNEFEWGGLFRRMFLYAPKQSNTSP